MLFDNYDLLMDSPNSTVKMRKLILQLAVQGKLVEQDPNDEPASELLKLIKAEKEKLVVEGKIKKQKPLLPITENEIPYELPEGWAWTRLGNIVQVSSGDGLTSKNMDSDGTIPVYGGNGITGYHNKYNVNKQTIVIGRVGYYCGSIHLTQERVWVTDNAFITKFPETYIDQGFLIWLLKGTDLKKNENATAQPVISGRKIYPIIIGVPPLAEQKRIVSKVDQLMQLCDQLDACQKKAATKYESLNDAALEKLLSSKTIDEFADHWRFLCNNFELIYNDSAHVNKLRQAILQLAVQGKLALQDPTDEPAGELLKRIKAEKEKLITEGKIKKQKLLPPITEDKIPYELPNGWEWVSLGELGEINPRINVDNDEIDVSFIPMKMISEKYGTPHSFDRRKWAEVKKGFTYFMNNDVGLAKITPCFENGKSTVFKGLLNGVGAGTTELHIFRQAPKLILPEYVLIFFKCPKFLNDAKEKMTGTAGQKRVPRDFVRLVPFPLPSISEQKRIVAKVDQLMNFCYELETRLNRSKKDSEMLMQAVLLEAC